MARLPEDDDALTHDERRALALILAVVSHGLSNLAHESVPAGWRTILQTSEHFRSYLEGRDPQDK